LTLTRIVVQDSW